MSCRIHLSLFCGAEILGIFSLFGGITLSLFCGTTGVLGIFLLSAFLLELGGGGGGMPCGCRQGGFFEAPCCGESGCRQGGIVEAPGESGRARFLA